MTDTTLKMYANTETDEFSQRTQSQMHEAARAMQVVERGEEGSGPRCATKSLPGTATIQVCDVRYLRRYGPRPARYSPSPFVNHSDTTVYGTRQTSFVLIGNSASRFRSTTCKKVTLIDQNLISLHKKSVLNFNMCERETR